MPVRQIMPIMLRTEQIQDDICPEILFLYTKRQNMIAK